MPRDRVFGTTHELPLHEAGSCFELFTERFWFLAESLHPLTLPVSWLDFSVHRLGEGVTQQKCSEKNNGILALSFKNRLAMTPRAGGQKWEKQRGRGWWAGRGETGWCERGQVQLPHLENRLRPTQGADGAELTPAGAQCPSPRGWLGVPRGLPRDSSRSSAHGPDTGRVPVCVPGDGPF